MTDAERNVLGAYAGVRKRDIARARSRDLECIAHSLLLP